MRVKIANSAPKTAKLKTKAVTKVAVDAVFAVPMLDLQTSQPLKNKKGGKEHTWWMVRKGWLEASGCVYILIEIVYFDDA